MSRKPETTFIESVHKHLPKSLYRIKNNNVYNGGQADCWYSGLAGDLWIEYKFIARVPAAGVKPDLSTLQTQWLHDRYVEGRNVAVIVGTKQGGVLLRDLLWEGIITPINFTQQTKSRLELARWIQSETEEYGENHDKKRSRDIPSLGKASATSRRQPANLCRPVRAPRCSSLDHHPEPD